MATAVATYQVREGRTFRQELPHGTSLDTQLYSVLLFDEVRGT